MFTDMVPISGTATPRGSSCFSPRAMASIGGGSNRRAKKRSKKGRVRYIPTTTPHLIQHNRCGKQTEPDFGDLIKVWTEEPIKEVLPGSPEDPTDADWDILNLFDEPAPFLQTKIKKCNIHCHSHCENAQPFYC